MLLRITDFLVGAKVNSVYQIKWIFDKTSITVCNGDQVLHSHKVHDGPCEMAISDGACNHTSRRK